MSAGVNSLAKKLQPKIHPKLGEVATPLNPYEKMHKEAECYQQLFDLMSKEHGLNLTQSEMQEIISVSKKVVEAIDNLEN